MQHAMTVESLAAMLGGQVDGPGDIVLTSIDTLDEAKPGSLTFIRSNTYAAKWPTSRASAALVSRHVEMPSACSDADHPRAIIRVDDADEALVAVLGFLSAQAAVPPPPPGIHPSALVDPSATIHPSAAIGPMCLIQPGASVGANTILHSRVTIGHGSSIGQDCILHTGVTVYHNCTIHNRCIIHAHVVIGADGFGYIPHPAGRGHVKVPHLGSVVIEDDVEIGACSCVDRGKFSPTTIGRGTKIDNLVQVAHNCTIGQRVILCAQTGISGSCSVGDDAMLGGQVGVRDNISIGARTRIGGQSGVMEDVGDDQAWFGTPAQPGRNAFRTIFLLNKLTPKLREMEKRLAVLEKQTLHKD